MNLSIITINYNNREGLERTIKSIIHQTSHDFEYIIVDGNSVDDSQSLFIKYGDSIAKYVSEPDKGIYNAMNKGVGMASGEYCLFMNSGDELYSNTTVEEILNSNLQADFIEGITYIEALNVYRKPQKDINASFYMFGRNNYHQSSIISRRLLLKRPYDETLKIASDLKFNFLSIVIDNCSYETIDVVISKYELGGRSSTIKHDDELRKIYETALPKRIINDYLELELMHVSPSKVFTPIMNWMFRKRIIRNSLLMFKKTILGGYVSKVPLFNDLMRNK